MVCTEIFFRAQAQRQTGLIHSRHQCQEESEARAGAVCKCTHRDQEQQEHEVHSKQVQCRERHFSQHTSVQKHTRNKAGRYLPAKVEAELMKETDTAAQPETCPHKDQGHILALCFNLPPSLDAPPLALLLLWTGVHCTTTTEET